MREKLHVTQTEEETDNQRNELIEKEFTQEFKKEINRINSLKVNVDDSVNEIFSDNYS